MFQQTDQWSNNLNLILSESIGLAGLIHGSLIAFPKISPAFHLTFSLSSLSLFHSLSLFVCQSLPLPLHLYLLISLSHSLSLSSFLYQTIFLSTCLSVTLSQKQIEFKMVTFRHFFFTFLLNADDTYACFNALSLQNLCEFVQIFHYSFQLAPTQRQLHTTNWQL